ncbi:MAG TPA: CAP domain-containing protein [Methyloceanibacter sp.]|nr:CAP domain-containing protein [Methyloceanibacter sp.]
MGSIRTALLSTLGFAAASQLVGPTSAQQFEVPASAKAAIIAETNAYRQTKGLAPLRENASASEEAQSYADYLAKTARQGHSADGQSPFQRLRASGAKFCKFRGENWHESWTRPERVSPEAAINAAMTFWKHSPGHERALRSASTEIGVGMAGWRHGNQWYYQEIQVFIDTSCLKPVQTASNDGESDADRTPPLPDRKPGPPLPDRNPSRP